MTSHRDTASRPWWHPGRPDKWTVGLAIGVLLCVFSITWLAWTKHDTDQANQSYRNDVKILAEEYQNLKSYAEACARGDKTACKEANEAPEPEDVTETPPPVVLGPSDAQVQLAVDAWLNQNPPRDGVSPSAKSVAAQILPTVRVTVTRWLQENPPKDGTNGVDGTDGTNGVDGVNGADATQEMVNLAVAQYCSSDTDPCRGPAGPEGIQGPAGPAGERGDPGPLCPSGWVAEQRVIIVGEGPDKQEETVLVCVQAG